MQIKLFIYASYKKSATPGDVNLEACMGFLLQIHCICSPLGSWVPEETCFELLGA